MVKLFSSSASKPKEAHRSVFGSIFNMHLGASINPIKQAVGSFVLLIAQVFAMNGLFPKDHAAFKGQPGAKLTLSHIIQTAWKNLSFTKAGAPKVLLFFAVLSGIILIFLSVITAAMLGLAGQAHAATSSGGSPSSFFTVQNPQGDLALNWIDFLFNPDKSKQALANIAATTTQNMPTTFVQTALATALGFYSNAILIIAAFILFYHLTAMVVETAHHGVPMGKRANQIWAPIRLVVAIGLLVPISSTGLNSGQYIVIQMAKWGSALASNVWAQFVQELTKETAMPQLVPANDVTATVYNLSMMYACEYAHNYTLFAYPQGWRNFVGQENINGWGWSLNGSPTPPSANGSKYSFTNKNLNAYDICGSYTIPDEPVVSNPAIKQAADSIWSTAKSAFTAANTGAGGAQMIGTEIQCVMDFSDYPPDAGGPPPNPPQCRNTVQDIQTAAQTYQKTLWGAVQKGQNILSGLIPTLAANSTKEGWIAAGAWFNQLSGAQAQINEIFTKSLPTTVPPQIGMGGGPVADTLSKTLVAGDNTNKSDANKNGYLSSGQYERVTRDVKTFSNRINLGPSGADNAASTGLNSDGSAPKQNLGGCSPGDQVACILFAVEKVAEWEGVWNDNNPPAQNGVALGVQFDSAQPLLDIASLGHKCVLAALNFFNYAMWAVEAGVAVKAASIIAAIPGWGIVSNILGIVSGAGPMVSTIFLFIGALFLTLGITMAYIIPLFPFIHFFLNTITWITCVAESIIAIPLVALAHLSPEGDGLPGQAKGAYQMIFSVFLRPVLMVFGLICGLLVLYVATGLLNALYGVAVAGTGVAGLQGSHLTLSRMLYTIMYCVFLFTVAEHAFAFIGLVPNKAMEWMSGKGLGGEKMGDVGQISTVATGAAAYISQSGVSQISGMEQRTMGGMNTLGQQVQSGAQASKAEKGAVFSRLSDLSQQEGKPVNDIIDEAQHDPSGRMAGLVKDAVGEHNASDLGGLKNSYNSWTKNQANIVKG